MITTTVNSARTPGTFPLRVRWLLLALAVSASGNASAAEPVKPVKVVTTLPAYAAIAQAVGGQRVEASSISRGDEDAHFVKPKPSFALMLRDASLFVTTGLDLELWSPVLVDKSGNRRIRNGQPGYVSASEGIELLDVPETLSRSAGDVHIYGNPHVFTSPLAAKRIAANIASGLKRVDPQGAADYDGGLQRFQQRIDVSLYGPELVEMLGSATLDPLARENRLVPFLRSQSYQGRSLLELLGGWLGQASAFRGAKLVAYHKNWIYLTDLLGLQVVDYVEPKPGIPPSARHVHALIELVEQEQARVLLSANYFGPHKVQTIAERTGCRAVIVPMGPGGDGPQDYFELIDLWIGSLAAAFGD